MTTSRDAFKEKRGSGRHNTQTDEWIGEVVITHTTLVKITCLFPETMDIA